MAYTFNNITIDEIDSAGALLYNIGTFTAALIRLIILQLMK